MEMNGISLLIAAGAAWLAGAIWYTVLGRAWQRALGWTESEMAERKTRKMSPAPFVVSFLAEIMMATGVAAILRHTGRSGAATGLLVGAARWLHFILTTVVVNNLYPGRKLMLSAIDGLHWLLVLLIEGAILGAVA